MRVTLIHNPVAGGGDSPRLRAITHLVRRAGHEVRLRSSKDEDLLSALARPADLVAVAGGDGTVAKVARLMRGRATPIAPLPTGTANNIGTALGLTGLTLEQQIRGWEEARRVSVDIVLARGPWGLRPFIEAFGIGLFSRMMSTPPRHRQPDAKMAHALRTARETLEHSPAIELEASLDGRECSGRYIVLEAMNIGLVGPNLKLAAHADPGDRQLDVVLVRAAEREMLRDCIVAEENGEPWPCRLPALRGRRLRIAHGRFPVHIDDVVWPERRRGRANREPIEIAVDGEAVYFLAPARVQAT